MDDDTFKFKMKKERLQEILPLSDKTGSLENTGKRLKDKYLNLWWNVSSEFPCFDRAYTKSEKLKTEKEMDHLIEKANGYSGNSQYKNDPKSSENILANSASQARDFLNKLGNLLDIQIEDFFVENFIRSTGLFLERVKKFDPELDIENIYQALRNIWIMNSIQVFLGQRIDCTAPMFAYSMLYPYTDNILDNVYENLNEKLHLSRILRCWLEGTDRNPGTAFEHKILKLVRMIEGKFSRERFPLVYQSLLLIFNAQLQSMNQQKQLISPFIQDVLGISFEKGGYSVLADGFLLKGNLKQIEQDFCFGWGTFLQLSDDIQDIFLDQKFQHVTVFSQIAGFYKLDQVTNKLFNYIAQVLDEFLHLPELQNLKKFSKKNFFLLVMEAIGKNSQLYSRDYVKEVEIYFPFSFSYLKRLRKKLEKLFIKKKRRLLDLNTVSAGLMALSSRLYEK